MKEAVKPHIMALYQLMDYCVATKKRGLLLKPKGQWNRRDKKYKFKVSGVSDTKFCKDKITHKNVGGHSIYLNWALVAIACQMQKIVVLSVTEAELIQVVEYTQDILFVWQLLTEMDLIVDLPMILETDNKGAIDIINNWASSGQMQHINC